jgi:hypothetical protein
MLGLGLLDGDPGDWPAWTDSHVWELGPICDVVEPFEPSPTDWEEYRDLLERLDIENSFNARFA